MVLGLRESKAGHEKHLLHFLQIKCTVPVFVESLEELFDFPFSLNLDRGLDVLLFSFAQTSSSEPVFIHFGSQERGIMFFKLVEVLVLYLPDKREVWYTCHGLIFH